MNRRDACKTIILGGAGLVQDASVANATDVHSTAHQNPSPRKAVGWQPRFFSPEQNETVTVIAELIIPETDTPGARAAKANEHMDLVLSEESTEVQQSFLKGLAWIDQRSRQLFGADFRQTDSEQQTSILTSLAAAGGASGENLVGRHFFEDIKRRTTFAYYTSEIGIHQELKYQGNSVLNEWPGCPHPGHHGDSNE